MARPTKKARLAAPTEFNNTSSLYDDDFHIYHEDDFNILFHNLPHAAAHALGQLETNRGSKRSHRQAFEPQGNNAELPQWVAQHFPDFLPKIPGHEPRKVVLDAPNPFIDDEEDGVLHPMIQHAPVAKELIDKEIINAFIKVRWNSKKARTKNDFMSKVPLRKLNHNKAIPGPPLVQDSSQPRDSVTDPQRAIGLLPPRFGDAPMSDIIDIKLWEFYIGPLCEGRTVIKSDNTYLHDVAPMAETSECVRHALLSLSATYIMDFERTEAIELRASYHHRRAVELLGKELSLAESYEIGKGDHVLAALMLLSFNEVVNWENDHTTEDFPKWYRSGKKAEYLLRYSNVARKYRLPQNIQSTRARSQLGQLFCLDNVMSECVYPLDLGATRCSFPWLLNGTEREQRKIVGTTGLSSKLMHYYARITFLCIRLWKKPTAVTSITVAKEIEQRLENFWQWSDISEGYLTSDELMADCASNLDLDGHVTTNARVADLIAESYVAAAQIYLMCRLFRLPRQHPKVQTVLRRLLKTIDWQPTSGHLFTAQTPMFSVFVAGLVACKEEDREIVRKWFRPICEESRGNVPPAWRGMQYIWAWQDTWNSVESDASSDPSYKPRTNGFHDVNHEAYPNGVFDVHGIDTTNGVGLTNDMNHSGVNYSSDFVNGVNGHPTSYATYTNGQKISKSVRAYRYPNHHFEEDIPISELHPWWGDVAEALKAREGRMSLC